MVIFTLLPSVIWTGPRLPRLIQHLQWSVDVLGGRQLRARRTSFHHWISRALSGGSCELRWQWRPAMRASDRRGADFSQRTDAHEQSSRRLIVTREWPWPPLVSAARRGRSACADTASFHRIAAPTYFAKRSLYAMQRSSLNTIGARSQQHDFQEPVRE